MNFKKVISILSLTFLLLPSSSIAETKRGFSIVQDGKSYKKDEVTIKRDSFTILSPHKEFAFVLSNKPIKFLDKQREIIKLIGTGEAFSKGNALLYKNSERLNNYQTCDVFYKNLGKGCKEYIKEKVTLGFKDRLVDTFGAFYIEPNKWVVERIEGKKISQREEKVYYLYLFEETHKVGEVAVVQNVSRIKLNMK